MRWIDVTDVSDERLEAAFSLYERTFEEELREPRQVLVDGIGREGYHLVLGQDESGQILAMASVHYLAEVRYGFIVYLLIDDRVQSKGLGHQLLFHVEQLLQADADCNLRGIILETEREDLVHTAQDKQDCQRRARFFTREGYHPLEGVYYLQPPLNETTSEVQLELRVKQFADRPLSETEVREIVQSMYLQKYQLVNRIDPDVMHRCYERLFFSAC